MSQSDTTIFHNPACSTSRNVLAILRAAGETPEIVEYLKTGWTAPQLHALFSAAGLQARDALRRKDLVKFAPDLTTDADEAGIIAAMVAYPALVERPFVVTVKGTRLCRPPARVAEILPHLPKAPVLASDGKVIFDPAMTGVKE